MSDLEVRADWKTAEVRALMAKLSGARLNRALSVAVNGAARQLRTMASRQVSQAMGVRRKDVDDAFVISPYSSPATLEAVVRGRGAPLPLIRFAARQTAKGVTANAWGTRRVYPHTFIATMKSGHEGVFVRLTRKRFPIKELWGAGVAKTMAQDAVSSTLEAYGAERLQANVMRQLDRATRFKG